MLRSCAATDFQANDAYRGIVAIVMAIGVMIGVDTVFHTGRACDKATTAITDTYNLISLALARHFDTKDKETRFHQGELMVLINQAETLSSEADNEPRFYRDAFQSDLFAQLVLVTRHLRFYTTFLEYTAAEARVEGGPKIAAFTQIAGNGAVQPIIASLSAKNILITNLIKIFVLDRKEFQQILDSPIISKQLENQQGSEQEFAELVKDFMDSVPRGTTKGRFLHMDEDPAVTGSVVSASLSNMMMEMNMLQNAILAEHNRVED